MTGDSRAAGATLRIHGVLPVSRANGPGSRWVLWVQGCARRCPGCFNPETHDPRGGRAVLVDDLLAEIVALEGRVEGVTVTGGEPMEQPVPLAALLGGIRRRTALSAVLFTGWEWEELREAPAARDVLASVDVVVAGPYDPARREARGLIGSANQTVRFLTDRYGPADLAGRGDLELVVTRAGEVIATGVGVPAGLPAFLGAEGVCGGPSPHGGAGGRTEDTPGV